MQYGDSCSMVIHAVWWFMQYAVCTRLPLLESCFFPRTKGTSLCWLSEDSHHPLQRRWWWCPGPGCRSSRRDILHSATRRQPQNSSTAPGMVPHLCRFYPSLPLSCPPYSRASPISNQKGEVKIKQNKSNKQTSLKEWNKGEGGGGWGGVKKEKKK